MMYFEFYSSTSEAANKLEFNFLEGYIKVSGTRNDGTYHEYKVNMTKVTS